MYDANHRIYTPILYQSLCHICNLLLPLIFFTFGGLAGMSGRVNFTRLHRLQTARCVKILQLSRTRPNVMVARLRAPGLRPAVVAGLRQVDGRRVVRKLKFNEAIDRPNKEVAMRTHAKLPTLPFILATALIVAGLLAAGVPEATAHGGKTHAETPFSTFEAVQKAVALYDRLIVSGKLPEAWETGLASIHVTVRGTGSERETVVQFQRTSGDPDSVYFYFNGQGDYAGSNFTGK